MNSKYLNELEFVSETDNCKVYKKVPFIKKKRSITDYIMINADNYSFKTWIECFPDREVKLRTLIFNPEWFEFFDIVGSKDYFKEIEKMLSKCLSNNKIILPYAELVFNIFNILSPNKIRIVIMGQDPYPGMNKVKGKMIPQATGISFSVPFNFPKPESLINIYHNLLNFGHIKKIPKSGNLIYWILQGCFMVNASLTTFLREKNVHRCIWRHFTDDLLDYLNKKLKNLVFMVWGKDAHVLCQKIDPKKHYIITSSHPSPLSYGKTFIGSSYGNHNDAKKIVYPSFKNTDHFGKANKYLEIVGQKGIFWDVID